MDTPSSFTQTLNKLESQLKKFSIAFSNTNYMYRNGDMGLAYDIALQMEEIAERIVMLTRTLPAYTGNPKAKEDVDAAMAYIVPVEIGFTEEGWFSLRLPLLLPKKEQGSASYIRSILLTPVKKFFDGKEPVRFHDCVLIYRHVYSCYRPERQQRDHDNIETNMVSDIVAMYTMVDDAPTCCRHYYCSASSTQERTEVYVVPRNEFSSWLEAEQSMPEEGVVLYENVPIRS